MEYSPSDPSTILGKGGFADVFRGTYKGSTVAIKRVLQTTASLDREREKEALTQLDHPNVIRLLHEEEDVNFRFYVLELCEASLDYYFLPDSNQKKYKGSIPSDKDAFIQLAEGLQYIHSKGLVHRDVKPGNVLISANSSNKDGSVLLKWSDFGLCRPVNERGTYTASGIKGTIDWLAPEILKMMENSPDGYIKRGTIKSDTFSAGAVFFYILRCGNHPFGKGLSIPSNVRDGKDLNRKDLGSSWFGRKIILGMIHKDVEKRIALNDAIEKLQIVQYSASEKYKEMANLCEDYNSSEDNKFNEVKLAKLHRLIDQDVTLGIPVNERSNILRTICMMERLHEPSRERVVQQTLIDQGENIYYSESLCRFITLRNISESHLIKMITLFLDGKIKMLEWVFGISNKLFFDLYSHSWLNNYMLASVTKFLIDRGLNLSEINRDGTNVLHFMCNHWKTVNLVDRIELLTEKFGIPVTAFDFKGCNALHYVCNRFYHSYSSNDGEIEKEQGEITKIVCDAIVYLSKHNVDVNGRDHKGRTPLFYLNKTGHFPWALFETKFFVTRVTRVLIDLGLDINAADVDGTNILHRVCAKYQRQNLAERIYILIKHGIAVNALDRKGWNALHYLCIGRKVELIKRDWVSFYEAGVQLCISGVKCGDKNIMFEGFDKNALFLYYSFCKLELFPSRDSLEELKSEIRGKLAEL